MPTPEIRSQVAGMHERGLSQPEIAAAIGITVPTLVRHYRREVESQSDSWRKMKGMTDGD